MEHEPSPENDLEELVAYVRSLPERDEDGVTLWNAAQKEIIIENIRYPSFANDVRLIRELRAKGDPESRRFAGAVIEEMRTRIKDTPGL